MYIQYYEAIEIIIKNTKFIIISSERESIIMQSMGAGKSQLAINKKYQNMQVVGNGTFGCVYLAKNLSSNGHAKVAIKHVHQNKKYKNRQLQILKNIKHPNIVELYEHYYEDVEQDTYLNLIMEYVPHTLSSLIKDHLYCKTFMDNQAVVRYSYGLIRAIHYLESKGIAHRDIKPSNILLTEDVQAKLCDFGSAKVLVSGQKNISYICSRYYRSPELILGAIDYATTIDVWSLGCCICEMMINRPMFDGGNNNTLLLRIIKTIGEPSIQDMEAMKVEKKAIQKLQPSGIKQRILKFNPEAPLKIIQLLQKMLVYNPKRRIKLEDAVRLPVFEHLHQSNTKKI